MAAGHVLRLGRCRIRARFGERDPAPVEVGDDRLPRVLALGAEPAPPAVAVGVGLGAPARLDLVLVLGVIEAVEHVVRHECSSFSECGDGVLDRRDLPRQPGLLRAQQREVLLQGRRLDRGARLPVRPGRCRRFGRLGDRTRRPDGSWRSDDLGDRRQAQPQLAQQQDALQAQERALVVVAVAVRGDPRRRQQTDVVVVPQGAARGAGQPCDLLDRPVPIRHAILLPSSI